MSTDKIPMALSTYGMLQNKENRGSYGLGLAIVKMLLDAQGIELLIESQQKKGTTIQMTFPKWKLVHNNNSVGV